MGTAGIDSYITKIKHIKRHDDHMAIKKQSFIKKSKKRIEKSNIEISIFKKYWYLSIYRNTLISSQFTELDPYRREAEVENLACEVAFESVQNDDKHGSLIQI